MLGYDERELGERRHEEEYYKRIGERDEKCRHAVVYQRALLVAADVYLLSGVGAVTVDAEGKQHNAARYLQDEAVVAVVDEVHHEAHSETCYQGVDKVAHGGADACYETVPAALVERALYAEDSNGTHRRRRNNAY